MRKIKELRKQHGHSQSDLAAILGVSLRTIQNYESGDVDVPRKNLDKIAQHYNVSVAHLFSINDSEDISSNIQVNEPLEIFKTKSGNNIEELASGKYLLTVPMVPFKAHATYISEFQDAEYISDLTKVSFIVDRVPRGKYMAFEIQNDSMNDSTLEHGPSRDAILNGDIVLGRELGKQHWTSKLNTNGYPYWIIVHKDTIVCKQITHHDTVNGVITCHSLNNSPEFQDFQLKLDECYQLFNIIKKQI